MVFLILKDRVYVNNFITYGIACCVTHFNVQIIYEQKVQECDATKVKCLFNSQPYKKITRVYRSSFCQEYIQRTNKGK